MRIAAFKVLESHRHFQEGQRYFELLSKLAKEFITLRGPYLAAAIAFYAFLSLFPLTIGLISLLHSLLGHTDFETIIVEGLSKQIPVLAEPSGPSFVEKFVTETTENTTVTSSVTGLVLFVAALGVFGAIRESINIMWGLRRRRSFFKRKIVEGVLMLGGLLLLFASLIISTVYSFFSQVGEMVWADASGITEFMFDVISVLAPFLLTGIVFTFLYLWLPHTRIRVREILPIALLSAVVYEIAKLIFIVFIHHLSDRFFSLYGSVATLMMFFTFIYVQSTILLVGAMLSAKWVVYRRMQRTSLSR